MTDHKQPPAQILTILDDIKAIDIVTIDVSKETSVTDMMIICSGRSSRHTRAIAESLLENMKEAGVSALGTNGLATGEWILVDYGDFIIHIMQPETRAFYNLEGLWQKS